MLLYVIRNGFLKTTAGREERRDENEEQSMEETRSEQHRRGETLEREREIGKNRAHSVSVSGPIGGLLLIKLLLHDGPS